MTDSTKIDEEAKKYCKIEEYCAACKTNKSSDDYLNESLELSLPESFDDNVSEFNCPPPVQLPAEAGVDAVCTTRLLEARLRQSEESLDKLTKEKDGLLRSLVEGIHLSDGEIQQIRLTPPSERSFFQAVALAFHGAVKSKECSTGKMCGGSRQEVYKNTPNCHDNVRVSACDQLDHVVDTRGEAVKSSCNTEAGKECVHDAKKQEHDWQDRLHNEIESLQQYLNRSQRELENAVSNESDAMENVRNLETVVDNLRVENQFLQKEKDRLLEKSEKSDTRVLNLELSLQEATSKVESLMKEVACTNLKLKDDKINAANREIEKVRLECQQEISLYKKHVEKKFENQVNVLKEANVNAVCQHERAMDEVRRLKNIVESLDNDKDNKIIYLERQNADLRSAIKLKCMECARLKSNTNAKEEELKEFRTKLQLAHDEVMAHKHAFKILESESLHERQRLKDEIRRKNEQLEAYYEVQEQNASDATVSATNYSKVTHLHLLDKTRSLNKKCTALQMQVLILEEKLKLQDKKPYTKISKGTNTNVCQYQNKHQGEDDMQHQDSHQSIKGKDPVNTQSKISSVQVAPSEIPENCLHTFQKYHYIMSSVQDSGVRNLKDLQCDHYTSNTISGTSKKNSVLGFSELLMKHGVHHASVQ
mmetsp:Transcript_1568/g.2865  ORF Transcript_1568/g.2865 Transcript_1568/m.2865 type:complete len:649 (+) Transcript_1568:1986-3932(+)